jgi:hypothetical protein
LWYLSQLSAELVRSTALTGAAQEAELLELVNDYYSEIYTDVGKHLKPEGHQLFPLPARLTIDLGKRLNETGQSGMQVRLYSDYPFRTRTDGGPKDDFERHALARLRADPNQPVSSFEDFQGRPVLRYATARMLKANCLECHNFHPDSIKKDWRVGEVRGVLEIIRPLDQDVAQTRKGLQGTFLLMSLVSLALLGLSVVVLMGKRRT